MSVLGRKLPVTFVAVVAVLIMLVALLPAVSSTPAREVTLVARGMAFYLDGDPATSNPTLELRAGERVRVVFENTDRGMTHDFAVPALDVAMNLLDWNERGEVTFTAPDAPGSYEYVCRPHRLMMRGTIRVSR
ncbi:MAG: cupredoxin domain-containing protein [Acidobacteria bacterium]|nr:cupredoxin domain-containing protein [Acidobacteriota bacterium]